MTIVLLGYMGSGKSTVGKALAKQMNVPFVDLDAFIAEKEQSTIKDLFATKGEIYFRKKENLYLQQLLQEKSSKVIALGGGTPCYGNNMDLILQHTKATFHLNASVNELYNRLKSEKQKRPLIDNLDDENLLEFIGKHLFERNSFYRKATYEVKVDGLSTEIIVAKIQQFLL